MSRCLTEHLKAADLGKFDKQSPVYKGRLLKKKKNIKTLENSITFIIYESFLFYGLAPIYNKPLK